MSEFCWLEIETAYGQSIWQCRTKQATVEIVPRPNYCDRGKWQAFVLCPGYPQNPNPFDSADGFPRYYFNLDRAKAEVEALFQCRKYEPAEIEA